MKSTHGVSPVPTNVCRVPAGQCTKSQARSDRSSSSRSSRQMPERTRKSSCADSAWYMPDGLPGSSTASVKPRLREHLRLEVGSLGEDTAVALEHAAAAERVVSQPRCVGDVHDEP